MNNFNTTYVTKLLTPHAIPALILTIIFLSACRQKTTTQENKIQLPNKTAHLYKNNLSNSQTGNSSSLLKSQSKSPMHWQPWSKEIFKDAALEKKTIFAFIGSGTDPLSLKVLKKLNNSPDACEVLNRHHINIFIDTNIHPDFKYLSSFLSLASGSNPTSQFLVWFSYEGYPLSWTPLHNSKSQDFSESILRISRTVARMWTNSEEYVLENSRSDYDHRLSDPLSKDNSKPIFSKPREAIRQISSLYDPTSGTVDSISKLSVARYIKLLTAASNDSYNSEKTQKKYLNTAIATANKMLLQGLIDPLDGGVFSSVQKTTPALPVFSKTLTNQAYAIDALFSLYQKTKNKSFLLAGEKILAFTQKNLSLPDGSYAIAKLYSANNKNNNPYLWTLEEIKSVLNNDELQLCIKAFGISELGNIPLVDDKDRSYFKKNTLTWKTTPEKLQAELGMTPTELKQKLSSLTQKLNKRRQKKIASLHVEKLSTADSMALLSKSFITAYRATGKENYLKGGIALLKYIQTHYFDETKTLRHSRFLGKTQTQSALALDYALVTQAALEIYEATLNPDWLNFAYNQHLAMKKHLGNSLNQYISEASKEKYPIPYNVYNFITFPHINNTSSWAIIYSNLKRLSRYKNEPKFLEQAKKLEEHLLSSIHRVPVIGIDYLLEFTKAKLPVAYLAQPIDPAIHKVALLKNYHIVPLNKDISDIIPAAKKLKKGVLLMQNNRPVGTAATPDEFLNLISPPQS